MTLTRAAMRRRGWIVPFCVLIVVLAAVLVAGARSSGYRAEVVLAVPASGGPANTTATAPGTLAATYAALIPQSDGVVSAVARATGLPVSVARQRVSAVQEPDTSIVDAFVADSERQRALAGTRALLAAVVGPHRAVPSIPAGALQLVRAPETATVESRHVPGGPIPIGIVLGLCLGLAALIAWDRHDPRADDARDLEAELALPVTTIGRHLYDATMLAVLERWHSLAKASGTPSVALVAATSHTVAVVQGVADRLALVSSGNARFACGGPPGGPAGGELTAVEADLVVLVAVRGDRLVDVRRSVRALEQLGASPQWAIFAHRDQ